MNGNGSNDAGSLDNLRDIADLPPVSWWPPAPGWWILLAIVVAVLGYVGWRRWRRFRANAYRRAARKELKAATNPAQVAAILKRTALVAYPRIDVASMTGPQWCDWLTKSSGLPISGRVKSLLTTGVFCEEDTAGVTELSDYAATWIDQHQDLRSMADKNYLGGERKAIPC